MKFLSLFKFNYLSPSQKIAGSFAFVIVTGAILLSLPIANQDGRFFPFLDALFMATSATCVTGLAVVAPVQQFTLFGQLVLLVLIQIGGFGLMTIVAAFILGVGKRLSIKNKIAMRAILNHDYMLDFRKFLLRIFKYTVIVEGSGAVLLSLVFIPEYGFIHGGYIALFTSISAFCNAGLDVIGASSLVDYVNNPIVNIVVMLLIIVGGLGFVVYFDIRDKFSKVKRLNFSFRNFLAHLSIQTKIVLLTTALLIFIPATIFMFVEYNNPDTIGNLSFPSKVMASLFSSVTLRTAGFSTLDFGSFYGPSHFIMVIGMFIGGSPGGTAGGIKTTTLAVLALFVICNIREDEKTNIFKRSISTETIIRATTVFTINLVVLFSGIFLLLVFTDFEFLSVLFESASALATVGLSFGITPYLNSIGKLVIIMLMYVGRIGIITFIVSWLGKEKKKSVDYAEGNIMIG